MAKNGRFGGPLRPPTVILVGVKGSEWPIPVVGYNVQPVFNQFEADRAANGQIRPNMARNGCFGGPLRPPRVILVGAKGSQWPPPRCGLQCSTVFNQCSTNLRQVGPLAGGGATIPYLFQG